jgi:hypothetical protein
VLDDDGKVPPYAETISLRTARVIAADAESATAFVNMLKEIVAAGPDSYDSLVGRVFADG